MDTGGYDRGGRGPARGGQPYRDDRGGGRGGYQGGDRGGYQGGGDRGGYQGGDRGGYQGGGDRGGYQGGRGGYQGGRGGYQGDRGGYQGGRGGYQGDRGGYQGGQRDDRQGGYRSGGYQRDEGGRQGSGADWRSRYTPRAQAGDRVEGEEAQADSAFDRTAHDSDAPEHDQTPRAHPAATPEGGTGLAPPLAVLLAAAARELVLTLSVDADADLEPGDGPSEAPTDPAADEAADQAAKLNAEQQADQPEASGGSDTPVRAEPFDYAQGEREGGSDVDAQHAPSVDGDDSAQTAAESSTDSATKSPAEPIRSVLHQLDPISRRAVQDIRYEGLRHFGLTQVIVNQWGRQHPPLAVEALLAVALGQLDSGRRPAHTVVSQAVDASDLIPGCEWARGFINAMLRRVLRETGQVEYWMANEPVARFNAPDEWIDRLAERLGPLAERALDGSTLRAPMTLRVNRRAMARKQGRASMSAADAAQAYRGMLYQAGIGADPLAVYGGKKSRFEVPAALRLRQPIGVNQLLGFAEGLVSVQDAAAQLAADLLHVERGQRVLDACAAPGGKTCHLLETADCEVTAVDINAARLAMVADNLQRLGLQATLIEGDAAKPDAWWDGQPFDRILLDAPCTASGVVRRHPEIPWIRQQAAIDRAAQLQLTMLGQLWPLLKPGGVMLFVTCSILPEEGERQVRRFAERQDDVELLPSPGLLVAQQRGEADHDGFFYALLRKPA